MQFDVATLVNALSFGQQQPFVTIYIASIWVLLALIVASVRLKAAPRFTWFAFLVFAVLVLTSLALLFSSAGSHIVN